MKTLLGIFAFTLIFPSLGFAATQTAESCSYDHVNAAVSAASRGDTVVVPACAETAWSTTLTITQSLTMQGSGVDSTSIAAGSGISTNGLIYYLPSDASAELGYTFRVTGFTLDTKGLPTDAIHVRNMSNDYVQIRIDNNKLQDDSTTSTYRMVRNEGTIKGVIHSNTFTTSNKKIVDSYGQNTVQDWSGLTFEFASANNIYVEDNNITILDTPHSCGQGGKHVLRYNTYTYNGTTALSPWFDAHGNQDNSTCNSWATRGVEFYGNELTQTNNKDTLLSALRGGESLVFENHIITTSSAELYVREEYADSVCSETYTQHVNNSYSWSNLKNSTLISVEENPASDIITANVDYWGQVAGFNGTVGVGCGTLANRPETCTTGVGYWATDQSCSDLTGMVGANPTTPISGTLYKCTDTNTWTAYYTPYTYPHPLRSQHGRFSGSGSFNVR